MTIDQSGNVGIGTTTPSYKLQIAGDIVPTADNLYSLGTSTLRWSNIFAASSTVGDLIFSNDFRFVEDYETPQALILKNQKGEEVMRVDENGNLTIGGKLIEISSPAENEISSLASLARDINSLIKDALQSLGLFIENGIAKVKELVAEKITAKITRTDKLEMIDKIGNVWCVWIDENGDWQKVKSECNVIDTSGGSGAGGGSPPITDTTPPVIILLGDSVININVGVPYVDAGAAASDDVDGDISAGMAAVNSVDTSVAGTYTVTYNVSDAAGNAATEVIRTVIVAPQPEVVPEPQPEPEPEPQPESQPES